MPPARVWGPGGSAAWGADEFEAADGAAAGDMVTPKKRRGRPRKDNSTLKRRRCRANSLAIESRVAEPLAAQDIAPWTTYIPPSDHVCVSALRNALLDPNMPDQLTDKFDAVVDRAFGDKPRPLMGTVAEAEILNYQNATFAKEQFEGLGAAVYFVARMSWAAVVAKLVKLHDDKKLEICVDFTVLSSDETTLEMGFKGRKILVHDQLLGTELQVSSQVSHVISANRSQREVAMTKLLQAELIRAVAIRWLTTEADDDDGEADANFEILVCELPVRLFAADHMTGCTLFRCWMDILEGPHEFHQVSLHSRAKYGVSVGCSDRGSNNGKANRIYRMLRPGHVRLDNLGCAIHNNHLAAKAGLRPFRQITSGLTSFGLMLKPGGSVSEFRICLQTALRRQANPRLGTRPPPPEHESMRYRTSLFDLLLDPKTDMVQRLALECHFRGDVRLSEIDVFLDEDCAGKVDEILNAWSISASWSLMPAAVQIWSTHRWITNDGPLRKITLLDSVHSIKRGALQIYLSKNAEKENREGAPTARMVDGQIVLCNAPDDTITASQIWCALNAKTRMDMRQVARQPTCAEQLIMCVAINPLVQLHRVLSDMDTRSWELKQQAALKAGTPRLFKMVEAAKGNVTKTFWTKSSLLLSSTDPWQAIPRASWTLHIRALAFATITQLQGSVWYYLDYTWSLFPVQAFLLLDNENRERAVRKISLSCKYMYDEFMEDFLLQFPGEHEWTSPEATLMLTMIALYHSLTQQRIECRFAALRRLLRTKGGMTWSADLPSSSSNWILQRQRCLEQWVRKLQKARYRVGPRTATPEGDVGDAPAPRERARGPFFGAQPEAEQ